MSHHLPPLQGTDLAGNPVAFPKDLPAVPTVLLFGFQHDSRADVKAWKRALDGAGVPWMSLPTSPENVLAEEVGDVAEAMKSQAPEAAWARTVLVQTGGPDLLKAFGWQPDLCAKVVLVLEDGSVLFAHSGPFSDEAVTALLDAI